MNNDFQQFMELKKWRKENLKTHELLRDNGMEFLNYYASAKPSVSVPEQYELLLITSKLLILN